MLTFPRLSPQLQDEPQHRKWAGEKAGGLEMERDFKNITCPIMSTSRDFKPQKYQLCPLFLKAKPVILFNRIFRFILFM
ncbi:hypothetical protein XELAEV_18037589mg [Xenopus laevis]|uniref:Uncharacterized protein n=1 Tax=Xenopus laevis TaxID=8355 RepID=A0A974HAR6_XENLA|nr:hypothetical protein XELAEV_18037589mg [Xenopus laevis]